MSKDLGGVTEEQIEAGKRNVFIVEGQIDVERVYLAMQAAAPAAVADGERVLEDLKRILAFELHRHAMTAEPFSLDILARNILADLHPESAAAQTDEHCRHGNGWQDHCEGCGRVVGSLGMPGA